MTDSGQLSHPGAKLLGDGGVGRVKMKANYIKFLIPHTGVRENEVYEVVEWDRKKPYALRSIIEGEIKYLDSGDKGVDWDELSTQEINQWKEEVIKKKVPVRINSPGLTLGSDLDIW